MRILGGGAPYDQRGPENQATEVQEMPGRGNAPGECQKESNTEVKKAQDDAPEGNGRSGGVG